MIRLQKLIAQSGFTSRRNAEILIKNNKVIVNGKIAKIGQKNSICDQIIVNGNLIKFLEKKSYYVINKPKKVITTSKDPKNRLIILDLLDVKERIFPIGRLDYNTTGVLILTNDGDLAYRLMHPSFQIKRTYHALLNKSLSNLELKYLNSKKVQVNGKISLQNVKHISKNNYSITLHVGTYHHVKLLFSNVNKKVLSLSRVSFANITNNGLAIGKYRKLNLQEIKKLKSLTKMI